ncbi:hypothetical protein BDY24DRAFT_411613 [Mrakia frigida]|uniref:CHRD domain-containing protein n=1 Tax=Mrakia frigida TaxID=29902 RepID=UPI003FCC0BCA
MKFSSSLALLALPAVALAAPLDKKTWDHTEDLIESGVFGFTSTYAAYATPDQVVNGSQVSVPGEPGAWGTFKFGINAPEELICWNITAYISGNYSSPAVTATHIHQAVYGRSGPPRLAFKNPTITSPVDDFGRRVSFGCMQGPFTTGVLANGTDTASGFSLAQIEANPPGFFADTHTSKFVAGAIRGQLELKDSVY